MPSLHVAIDPVLLAHLRADGMSDGLIAHLAHRTAKGDTRAERRLRDSTMSTPVVGRDGAVSAPVHLADGVVWSGGVLALTRAGGGIPRTVAEVLPGRALSDVVGHPLLPAGAVVADVPDAAGIPGEPPDTLALATDVRAVRMRALPWSPLHVATTIAHDVRHDQGLKLAVWTIGCMLALLAPFAVLALMGSAFALTALTPLAMVCGLTVAMSRSAWIEGGKRGSLSNDLHAEEAAERWTAEGRWG